MSPSKTLVEAFSEQQSAIWTALSIALVLIYLIVSKGTSISTITSMLGFGTVEYTSAKKTVSLKSKDNKGETTLRALVESVVPPVRLSPLLFNGHLQTIYVASGRGTDAKIHYKRRIFESDHKTYPGQFATDWVVPKSTAHTKRDRTLPPRTNKYTEQEWDAHLAAQDTRPLLIVLHGLSGGSHEQYVRQCIRSITGEEGGFAAVVVNSRGCCYSKITTEVLFNARATWDVRQFVRWVRQQWPQRRLFAVGFSLGANILCNYLGEEGDACVIESAILVGNPWNLDVSNALLCSTTIGLHLYQRAMGAGLKKVFERHVDQISKNPNIDIEKVRKAKFLYEWDRYVQCASWGYPTESAYYRDASSVDAVLNIKIPVLALGAKDDPICADMAVPYSSFQVTPYVVMCATSIGGHLGWFEFGGDRWSNRVIHDFFTKFVKETQGATHPDVGVNGHAQPIDQERPKPTFDPILRRMHIPT